MEGGEGERERQGERRRPFQCCLIEREREKGGPCLATAAGLACGGWAPCGALCGIACTRCRHSHAHKGGKLIQSRQRHQRPFVGNGALCKSDTDNSCSKRQHPAVYFHLALGP